MLSTPLTDGPSPSRPPTRTAAVPRTGTVAAMPGNAVPVENASALPSTAARPSHPKARVERRCARAPGGGGAIRGGAGAGEAPERGRREDAGQPADRELPGARGQAEEGPGPDQPGEPDAGDQGHEAEAAQQDEEPAARALAAKR